MIEKGVLMKKKIVLAFDSFKGCISAQQACRAACQGILSLAPDAEVVMMPLSDGGEGLVLCLVPILGLREIVFQAHDPLMRPIEAVYAVDSRSQTAYMEMASTSGLTRLAVSERNPLKATTYGVGEMIADALRRRCRHIVMGIGGSATCDGGQGMLEALERHPSLMAALGRDCDITVACDVTNPLYGPDGAAYVFAPQKGASPAEVRILDERLCRWAALTERRGMAVHADAFCPGAGAAGGLGYALMTYLHARLMRGIDIVLDAIRFDDVLQGADLVITGEGKSDAQTLMGKVPSGVLTRASRADVPVLLLSGGIDGAAALLDAGFKDARSVNEGDLRPLDQLMQPQVACCNIEKTVRKILNQYI